MEGERVGHRDLQGKKNTKAQTVRSEVFGIMSLTLKFFNLQFPL